MSITSLFDSQRLPWKIERIVRVRRLSLILEYFKINIELVFTGFMNCSGTKAKTFCKRMYKTQNKRINRRLKYVLLLFASSDSLENIGEKNKIK